MIQLITFLIAQLIFVPVYLLTTDICTGRNGKWIHKVILILISPFAAYLYINFFLGFIITPENTPASKRQRRRRDESVLG